ncbi:MAG: Rpn family recombination-promoting nuclease/putative transposase [Selenomonas sp.]|uniref:Rpn family recombination-promoting nuclease/putative transposase n=1 Tax=Selenomonas sp. TaxID=2053611 RepID=UPI0025F4F7DC|nr:Rpn family recombination-promoting nuclease/putative transposase [Selenomonas sp.]MCI6086324.1 Rpn family recombination-promoting nuclease/putative transposase [Selenomonas sp.]
MANRQVKDSVFRKLFNNRKELAKLYQAIRVDESILAKDIKIATLRNVFLDSQRNDLSFLWKGQAIVLMEHQSTWNENMPLRMLTYIEKIYKKLIK